MSIAAKRTGGKQLTLSPSTTHARREADLHDAKIGLAKAIADDKPATIRHYWQQKVAALQWLVNGGDE